MILERDSYGSILREELARRMQSNPRYSQRAFARDLGLSPGELSELMRGVRKLSLRSVLRIAQSLGLNETETKHLGYLVQLERAMGLEEMDRSSLPPPDKRNQLSVTMFNVVSDWFCMALLNLTECEGFRWSERWIAQRLSISVAEVRAAIDRLQRVGLIEKKKSGFHVSRDYVISPEGIPSEAIRSYHRQILQKASHALDLQKVSEREIAGVGFAVDPKSIPALKKDISTFLDSVMAKYGRGKHRREVYHCEVALFRLTKPENET